MKFVQNLNFILLSYSMFLVKYSYEIVNKKLVALTLERPKVIYENPKYVHVYNLTSLRRSRSDPTHYIQFYMQYLVPIDNNMTVTLNVYEFMSNDYRPSFVKWPFKYCTFIKVLNFNILYSKSFSMPFLPHNFKFKGDNCYLEPGIYYFQNMSMPVSALPQLPFEKGRVFINQTNRNDEIMALAQMDVEFTMIPTRRRKN